MFNYGKKMKLDKRRVEEKAVFVNRPICDEYFAVKFKGEDTFHVYGSTKVFLGRVTKEMLKELK